MIKDKNDETLHIGIIDTSYLQHDEVRESFHEIQGFAEVEEPVLLHRAVHNRDTDLMQFFTR